MLKLKDARCWVIVRSVTGRTGTLRHGWCAPDAETTTCILTKCILTLAAWKAGVDFDQSRVTD